MSNFALISTINLERATEWHKNGIEDWSPAEWGNALAGECGELCNVLKKILQEEKGYQQAALADVIDKMEVLKEAAAQEIGDTFLYLNLVCKRLDLDIYDCIRDTFNRVSEREGFP